MRHPRIDRSAHAASRERMLRRVEERPVRTQIREWMKKHPERKMEQKSDTCHPNCGKYKGFTSSEFRRGIEAAASYVETWDGSLAAATNGKRFSDLIRMKFNVVTRKEARIAPKSEFSLGKIGHQDRNQKWCYRLDCPNKLK